MQNSGTASITLLGSVADLNAYLAAPDALQYTGEANANGNNAATLTITANDGGNTGTGGGTTALGTLAINITPANDAPTATNTSLITDEDVAHTFAIADFGIADIDTGDTLQQVRLDSLPEHGKLTLQGAMLAANDVVAAADIPSLRYEPDTHYNGTDQFSFSVFDGNAWSAGSADVALTVTSVNDAPLLTTPTTFSVEENQSVITTLGASDIEGDTLTYALVGGADRSLFSLDTSTGELSFNEAPNFEAPFNNNTDSTYEVEVQASDGQDVSSTQTIEVTVTDVNEAPVMTGQTSLHVDENTSGVVYTATADDPEGNALTYTLSGTDAELFQLDANNGTLTFKAPANYEAPVEANNDNTYDLLLTANDGSLNSVAQALAISIDNINEAPELTVNQGATVNTGRTITLTTAMLEAQDVDDTAAELTYTVTTLPSGGMLQLEGVGLAMNQTFTQADVEEGKVTYQAGKSAGQQSFTFTLADGGEDGAAAVVDQTFILTVRQKNPIQVTPNEPQPETPSGKPSVTETITNTGVSSGTAKLVENTGNANEVTATLPGGVSIVNQGARSAVVTQQALADLMGSINTQQPTNLNDQALIAEQWLNSRPSDLLLDIRTLVLSDTSNASTNTPILITGTADDGLGNGGHQEAFVIDTRSLASGHQIELDNIDFASIIGTTTVRGGAGNNVVIGDDADQTIILGAGDDELFGGGGNDVIGSEGGDDRLFGNSGNDELFGGAGADLLHGGSESDTASYTGNRDDYTITQRFGVVTVQASDDASNIDTLVNIETLTFADETLSLTYDESLQWLSGLYFQALGRQADVSGLQYWAQQHTNGMGHADIALAVLGSAETGLNLQEDAALGLLYTGLLGREADTAGQSYWNEQLAAGATIKDIAGDFMMSAEMRQHDMDVQQWDFLV